MGKKYFFMIGLLVVFWLFASCCSWDYCKVDFEFTQEELYLLRDYKAGDIVYFQSNLGDIDTIGILNISEEKEKGGRCFISKPPFHGCNVKIEHLPFDKWAGTSQVESGERKITHQVLISISKFPLQKRTDYSIAFKGFVATGQSVFGKLTKECVIDGKTLSNYYKITHSYPERIDKADDIEIVYWTAKNGLTAYTSKSGETWFLIE